MNDEGLGNQPIYQRILLRLDPASGQLDYFPLSDGTDSTLSSGSIDGIISQGHYALAGKLDPASAYRALAAILSDRSDSRALAALASESPVVYFEELEQLLAKDPLPVTELAALARWFAMESACESIVKLGASLLGFCGESNDEVLLAMLALHHDLTLPCVSSLARLSSRPGESIARVARRVDSWGRIHAIQKLVEFPVEDAETREWLLREGFSNSLLDAYTAYYAAVAGDLNGALASEHLDDQLLDCAGRMLRQMADPPNFTEFKSLLDYPAAEYAVNRYLHHLSPRLGTLEELIRVNSIRQFLFEVADGWEPVQRRNALARCNEIIGRRIWEELLQSGLAGDRLEHSRANLCAKILSVDLWAYHWSRLDQGSRSWGYISRFANVERMESLVERAGRTLPIEEIASSREPTEGESLFGSYCALSALLQGLEELPGPGQLLIARLLTAECRRLRNGARQALDALPSECWKPEIQFSLAEALARAPVEYESEELKNLLAGRRLRFGMPS